MLAFRDLLELLTLYLIYIYMYHVRRERMFEDININIAVFTYVRTYHQVSASVLLYRGLVIERKLLGERLSGHLTIEGGNFILTAC